MKTHQRHTGDHFADDIFKCIFVKEKYDILIWGSLKLVPEGHIDNKSALVQVMVWYQIDDQLGRIHFW